MSDKKQEQGANLSWYIATVVTIEDPDKRRRIQARGPHETEEAVPTEKLPWLLSWQFHSTDFQLPEVGESILVLVFGRMKVWTELPDKQAWQDFGDDYVNAWLYTHKDVLYQKYTETNGFEYKYVGDIKIETDESVITIKKKDVEIDNNDFNVKVNGGKELVITISNSTKITANKSKVEIKCDNASIVAKKNGQITLSNTAGAKIDMLSSGIMSISNNVDNLSAILQAIMQNLTTHIHTTIVGPTSPETPPDPTVVQKLATLKTFIK
jgi:hypothetical protein